MINVETNKWSKLDRDIRHYPPTTYIEGPVGEIISTDRKTLFSVPNNIIEYTVPSGIERILDGAFAECYYLKKIIFPLTLKVLGDDVFLKCPNLIVLNLPLSLDYFGPHCFRGSSISYIRFLPQEDGNTKPTLFFHNSGLYSKESELLAILPIASVFIIEPFVKKIRKNVFSGMHYLTEVVFPSNIEDEINFLHEGMFKGCRNLRTIRNLEWVREIPKETFMGCDLFELPKLPNVKKIGDYAFFNSNLCFLKIPENIEYIGEHSFAYCKFKHITIPMNVIGLGRWAFSYCFELNNATILGDSTKIGTVVFNYCTNLQEVFISSKLKLPNKSLGYGLNSDLKITTVVKN